MDLQAFAQAGKALNGSDEEWKRPLARMLGPYHPMGARDSIDPRLPFRWANGDREIPEWVIATMVRMLRERGAHMISAAEALERSSAESGALAK